MPHRLFIHNSLHSGDVLLTRVLIDAIIRKHPGAEILLQCRAPMAYLWHDYGVRIFECGYDYGATTPTPECPRDFEFFNAWFGTFQDILNGYGLTHANQIHTFNRQVHIHGTQAFLDLPTDPPVLYLSDLHTLCAPNTILVENGPALSGQCNHGLGAYVHRLASEFPQFNFLCSANPQVNLPNVYDGSSYNLLVMSDLSNKCIAFITQASGANACTYTRHNIGKPRFFFGYIYQWTIWDNSATIVHSYEHLAAALRERLCKG
jgi:hypothetical protein